jgi:hypothetical protein
VISPSPTRLRINEVMVCRLSPPDGYALL